jgi:hypothetical protein
VTERTAPAATMPTGLVRWPPDLSGLRRCTCGAAIVNRRSDAVYCATCSASRQRRWHHRDVGRQAEHQCQQAIESIARYADLIADHSPERAATFRSAVAMLKGAA